MKATAYSIMFLIVVFFILSITGCQTIKDNWDHQYNDDREDDMSGEWFREPSGNDTALYRIVVEVKELNGKGSYSKDVSTNQAGAWAWILPKDKIYLVEFNCTWKNSSPIHTIFFQTNDWGQTINFGLHSSGNTSGKDTINTTRNNVFEFGIREF